MIGGMIDADTTGPVARVTLARPEAHRNCGIQPLAEGRPYADVAEGECLAGRGQDEQHRTGQDGDCRYPPDGQAQQGSCGSNWLAHSAHGSALKSLYDNR